MEKRYQVFVSSTYQDLIEERQQVMQALLELDCIPSGMELFPAADETQWDVIKKVIEDCDYYVVIIGGRYGSLAPDGMSYTEKEYRYAKDIGIPAIDFPFYDVGKLRKDKTESEEALSKKLDDFRNYVAGKMCKYWKSPEDLGGKVSRSVIHLIKTKPGIGWVRADNLPDENIFVENVNLRKKVDELESQISLLKNAAPKGTEDLAQGNDEIELEFIVELYLDKENKKYTISWNEIMKIVLPALDPEGKEFDIYEALCNKIQPILMPGLSDYPYVVSMSDDSKAIVKTQLKALGIITPSKKQKSVRESVNYWTLTPYGESLLIRLCAIHKQKM